MSEHAKSGRSFNGNDLAERMRALPSFARTSRPLGRLYDLSKRLTTQVGAETTSMSAGAPGDTPSRPGRRKRLLKADALRDNATC